jgi:hypothetical protein
MICWTKWRGNFRRQIELDAYCDVSKTIQFSSLAPVYTFSVPEPIRILTAELDGDDGLLVTFSDGTVAGYVVEELLELRPVREPIELSRSRIDTRSPD